MATDFSRCCSSRAHQGIGGANLGAAKLAACRRWYFSAISRSREVVEYVQVGLLGVGARLRAGRCSPRLCAAFLLSRSAKADQTCSYSRASTSMSGRCLVCQVGLVSTLQPITGRQFQPHLKFPSSDRTNSATHSRFDERAAPNTDNMATRRSQYVFCLGSLPPAV